MLLISPQQSWDVESDALQQNISTCSNIYEPCIKLTPEHHRATADCGQKHAAAVKGLMYPWGLPVMKASDVWLPSAAPNEISRKPRPLAAACSRDSRSGLLILLMPFILQCQRRANEGLPLLPTNPSTHSLTHSSSAHTPIPPLSPWSSLAGVCIYALN